MPCVKAVSVAAISVLLLVGSAPGQLLYSVKRLDPLHGDSGSSAAAVNNATQIAGHSISQVAERPVCWTGNTTEALPVTGAGSSNFALGINSPGQVVGYASFPGHESHAALWTREKNGSWEVDDLGSVPGYVFSAANDLDDSGTRAVGYVDDATDSLLAIAWEYVPEAIPPWQAQTLGVLPTHLGSYASGLNNHGVAVGVCYGSCGARATRWTRTADGWSIEALPLLPGGVCHSLAFAVNEAGRIAGSAVARDGLLHAVLWTTTGAVEDLGGYPGEQVYARAINAADQVVGETWGQGLARAFLAFDGRIADLNSRIPPDTGWILRLATGISDQGHVVGEGCLDGIRHSFLLAPAILGLSGPEPGTLSMPNVFSIEMPFDEPADLYYSFSPGECALPGCTVVVLNIDAPRLLAVFVNSTVTIGLPEEFSGRTVYFQAAAVSACAVSNVVRHSFVESDQRERAGSLQLAQTTIPSRSYPNPFNPLTTIEYSISHADRVTVRVYDVFGQEVETLVDGWQRAGPHTISWDASGEASGVYFYRIETGDRAETRHMVLLR